MIRFNLRKLLDSIEEKRGEKVTLKEVSASSGCDKNALSRMINHPEVMPSASIIDKLVQYLFHERVRGLENPHLERIEMSRVISDFIVVYPDREDYWSVLPEELRDNPESTSLDAIWGFYSGLKGGASLPAHEQLDSRLREKLQRARKQSGEITVKFSGEELSLLVTYLPSQIRNRIEST